MNPFFIKKQLFAIILSSILLFTFVYGVKDKDLWTVFDEQPGESDSIAQKLEDALIEDGLEEKLKNSFGFIQKQLGKNEVLNFSYIKEKNNFLYYGNLYQEIDKNLLNYAKRLRRLKEKTEDTPFIFISPPEKDSRALVNLNQDDLILKTDNTQDAFLLYLQYVQIDSLDLRIPLKKSKYPYEELFYKTDQYFTTFASFETFSAIVDKLNTDYQESLDPFYTEIENYELTVYKEMMLGNMGKEVGLPYSGLDDFTLISPQFETDYKWEFRDDSEEVYRGRFEDILIDKEKLEVVDNHLKTPYIAYLNRINSWDRITNLKNPNGLKILCLRDLYFSPIACFLMPYCSEIHLISPFDSEIDIEAYLSENKFDYIFVEYSPSKTNETGFPFCLEEEELER